MIAIVKISYDIFLEDSLTVCNEYLRIKISVSKKEN